LARIVEKVDARNHAEEQLRATRTPFHESRAHLGAALDERDSAIRAAVLDGGMAQNRAAEITGLSSARISQIVKEGSDIEEK